MEQVPVLPLCSRNLFIFMNVVPIEARLSELQPITIECIETEHPDLDDTFSDICREHHYLEHREPKGEKLRYIVYTDDQRVLACLMFSHAAWNLQPREKFIGWNQDVKKNNLNYVANNSRFVIMPDVRVRNLATWILGAIVRRISSDWQQHYGHPIYALETFVDELRHHGSCYKAANWLRIGDFEVRKGQKALIGSTLGIYFFSLIDDINLLKNRIE